MSKASTKSIPLYDRFEREMALFGRHVKILSLVYQKNPIGILRLSRDTGLPMHKIRYSLKILEEEGLVEAKTVGAIPTEQSGKFLKTLSELVSRFKQEFDGLEEMIQAELGKEQR